MVTTGWQTSPPRALVCLYYVFRSYRSCAKCVYGVFIWMAYNDDFCKMQQQKGGHGRFEDKKKAFLLYKQQ